MSKSKKKNLKILIISLIAGFIVIFDLLGFNISGKINEILTYQSSEIANIDRLEIENIPEYAGKPYITINNNIPNFTDEEKKNVNSFEKYSKLDYLGRCQTAFANVCMKTMPRKDEKREKINHIYPTGWENKRYTNMIDGDYIYNRSHLIGWQLTAENANENNLITGTRYMNVEGMLPFENIVDDYFEDRKNRKNHVLYRVAPIFEGTNLLATGVQIEGYSVEDEGKGVQFNVFCYNVQPGIEIDYKTGNNWKK